MATKPKDSQNKKGRDDPPPSRLHLDKRAGSLAVVAHDGGDDDLLTTLQVSGWLGVSVQWLELGRVKKYGPRFLRLAPQLVRYKRGEVKAWLKERDYAYTNDYPDDGDRRRRTKAGA